MKKYIVFLGIIFVLLLFLVVQFRQDDVAVNYPVDKSFAYRVDFRLESDLKATDAQHLSSIDRSILDQKDTSLNWRGTLNLTRVNDSFPQKMRFRFDSDSKIEDIPAYFRAIEGYVWISKEGEVSKLEYGNAEWLLQSPLVRQIFAGLHFNGAGDEDQFEPHPDFDLTFRLSRSIPSLSFETFSKKYIALLKRKKSSISGHSEVRLSSDNFTLDRLILKRGISYQLTAGLFKSENLHIELTSEESQPYQQSVSAGGSIRVEDNLRGEASKNYYQDAMAQREIKGLNEQDVLSLQDRLSGPYDAQYAEAEKKLRSWLRLHPQFAIEIAEKSRSFELGDPRFSSFVSVLRDVGSPEAQVALSQVVRESELEPKRQMYYTAYLGDVSFPTDATIDFLTELARKRAVDVQLAQAAALGLGRIVKVLNSERDFERAKRIRKFYLDSVRSSRSNEELIDTLAVLGNMRDPEIWPVLRKVYEETESLDIKTSVISALRFVPLTETHQFLLDNVESPNQTLQFVALESLAFGEPAESDASYYKTVLTSSKDYAILQQTIKNLGSGVHEFKEFQVVLRWFIENCAQRELCSLAESFAEKKI